MTVKKLAISDLDESRQAFVLAMVHGNPEGTSCPRAGVIHNNGTGFKPVKENENLAIRLEFAELVGQSQD